VTTRPLLVRGLGVVSAAGVGAAALARALEDPAWAPVLGFEDPALPDLAVATCRGFAAKNHMPPLVARRLDRSAGLLAVAAREALARVGSPRPWANDRIGVCAATWNAGTEALVEVLKAVFLTAPNEAPPAQFPSTVANAPASQLGILEKLSGPNLTFFEKQSGGLRVLIEAARLTAHGRADAVLACGVDEAQWLHAESYQRLGVLRRGGGEGFVLAEGAASLLLAVDDGSPAIARMAGWGSAAAPVATYKYPTSPASLVGACQRALAHAGMEPGEVELVASVANGLPSLARLEQEALTEVFGSHRPAVLGVTQRAGEGPFGTVLRSVATLLVLSGEAEPRWPPPLNLRQAGFSAPTSPPANALVTALSAGGSAVAVVFTAR